MANKFRDDIVKALQTKFGDVVEAFTDVEDISIVIKDSAKMTEVFTELRDTYKLRLLVNLTSIEWEEDFEIVYTVVSVESPDKLNVRVRTNKSDPKVPSIVSVYSAANVQEREQYDLMGIIFIGHPNLTRILLSDDFVGHPLRKDFKVS